MNAKRLHRVRSCFTAVFGAIAILSVIAFAPKADANPNSVRFNPRYVYRDTSAANERARDRAADRVRASFLKGSSNLYGEYYTTPDPTTSEPFVPESKGPRRLPRAKGGFFNYKGKY